MLIEFWDGRSLFCFGICAPVHTHSPSRIWKCHIKVPFWPPIYIMPVVFYADSLTVAAGINNQSRQIKQREQYGQCETSEILPSRRKRVKIQPAGCVYTIPVEFDKSWVQTLAVLLTDIGFCRQTLEILFASCRQEAKIAPFDVCCYQILLVSLDGLRLLKFKRF